MSEVDEEPDDVEDVGEGGVFALQEVTDQLAIEEVSWSELRLFWVFLLFAGGDCLLSVVVLFAVIDVIEVRLEMDFSFTFMMRN